jgi:WD40 repeat protein
MIVLAVLGVAAWAGIVFLFTKINPGINNHEPTKPFQSGLPLVEIVFSLYNPFHSHGTTHETIGFVDANGLDRDVSFFNIAGGSAISWPKHFSTYAEGPRWSPNGDKLVFTIRDVTPNVRVIDSKGYMYGRDCIDIDLAGYHIGFYDARSVIAWISELNSGYEKLVGSDIGNDDKTILIYDVMRCKVIDIIKISIGSNYWLSDIDISKNYLSVMLLDVNKNRFDMSEQPYKILLFDNLTGDSKEFLGVHPSQSDDGTLLAYFDYTKDLIIENLTDGSTKRFETTINEEHDFSFICRPGWSSDNQWVVFNDNEGKIYKLNINTKELVYLTKGYCPDWR